MPFYFNDFCHVLLCCPHCVSEQVRNLLHVAAALKEHAAQVGDSQSTSFISSSRKTKKTNDLWDLEKCLQRCQSHSGVCRLVFDLGRCKNSVSAITLTFMLIGNPQSLIHIQREQWQQQRDFKESDFKLLPWKVCLFKEKLLCRIYSSHYFGHLWGWKPFKTKENISSFPTHSYYRGTVSLWRTTCRSWAWMTVYLKASQVQ